MGMPKVMRLLDANSGLMECRVCGAQHCANARSGGGYHYGAWQCQNGCRLDGSTKERRRLRPGHNWR